MSYQISLRDKRSIIVPTQAGLALKEHLLKVKEPKNLEIGGELYRSSEIISITKINVEAISEAPALPPGPRYNCVAANTSIQFLINQVAMKSKDWPKLVRDKAWRERTRLAIRAKYPERKFCDHRAGEHACLEAMAKAASQ